MHRTYSGMLAEAVCERFLNLFTNTAAIIETKSLLRSCILKSIDGAQPKINEEMLTALAAPTVSSIGFIHEIRSRKWILHGEFVNVAA